MKWNLPDGVRWIQTLLTLFSRHLAKPMQLTDMLTIFVVVWVAGDRRVGGNWFGLESNRWPKLTSPRPRACVRTARRRCLPHRCPCAFTRVASGKNKRGEVRKEKQGGRREKDLLLLQPKPDQELPDVEASSLVSPPPACHCARGSNCREEEVDRWL